MSSYAWQKSSYSPEGGNCVNVAAASDGTLRLQESDDPGGILATTRAPFGALLTAIKGGLRVQTER
ncbi:MULTISPECIES: DUF397 domain-containing protein [unclassified Streptomyces]|uniref:DUF397 domain-containing protein n=1 Tax=unclassified Streptomyces TaxID=2593676 RepID=UPI002E7A9C7D|nr:DUF397 domain-containing protein [Streptomyces sp. JV176]MEE1798838.1 DUF397 domain-containing protein [Streptomyces sp. JV176]